MALLTDFVHTLIGGNNPSTVPFGDAANQARGDADLYRAREAQNYAGEQRLSQGLDGQIAGTMPSVAQTQLRQGFDQNNADMMAAGAGSSGVNSVLAAYQARQAQGDNAARLAQAAAELRAREIAQAMQQQAQLHQVMGAQSAGLYGNNMDAVLRALAMKAQNDQANAQRDTVLGAAGLGGAAQIGAGLSSMGRDYFGSGSTGSTGSGAAPGFDGRGNNLMSPSF